MSQSIHESIVSENSWFRYLVWLPPFIFLFIIILLNWIRIEIVWNPPYLFAALNIVFFAVIMLFVSVLAARSYLEKRSLIILFLGSGMLAIGLGGLLTVLGIFGNNPNSIVTVYNTSVLISGFFVLTSAIFNIILRTKVKRSRWFLLTCYLVVTALISLLVFLVQNHIWPVYFEQGLGPTGTGFAVLYSTISLFIVAAVLLLIHSNKTLSFQVWYGLGLGLIAVGLIGVSTQLGLGDPLNWVGRISQYLGAVYILIAVISSIRETGTWMLPWEESLYEIEEKYHSLYNSMNEGVALHQILYDKSGKAIDYIIKDVNPPYEKIVGLKREDAINRKASEIYQTDSPPYLDIYSEITETGNPKTFEIYYEPLDRSIKVSSFKIKEGEFATVFEEITERKKYEKTLQEKEELLRLAQKSANLGIWDWHLESGRVNWTEELEELYGYTKSTFPGTYEAFIKNVHPDDVEKVNNIMNDAVKSIKPFDFDFRIIKSSGTTLWINCKGSTTLDDRGKARVFGVNIDITERKRMEQELIQKQTEIQTFFDNAHAGMVLFSGERPYTVLVHNKAYQEFFDEPFRTQGMVGLNIYQYAPEVDAAGVIDILDKVLETNKPKSVFDFAYESHQGKESWFNWHISPIIVNDKVEALVSMSIDVTDKHIAERALKRANERLKIASQAANAGIWEWNIKTGEIEWSPEMFELLGIDPEETQALFEAWENVIHREDVKKAVKRLDNAIKNHTFLDNIYRIIKPNGDIRWINALGKTEYDNQENPLWMTGICIDITERKEAEELIKKRSEELARSNADLKQFAYVASHDLKEPLRMIISFLQLLERRYQDQLDQEANEFIYFAVDGAKRLDHLITDLLEYSKITNRELQFTDVNTQNIIKNVINNLNILIDENEAYISYDSLPIIKGDEIQLERLFQNLIENSIKYRRDEMPHIHISAEKENNKYLFKVKDNGKGIDPNYLKRIFSMFQRLPHTEHEGTGIGLAIAQRIVHQHGGEIWAESEPGEGSTFYFTIPLR